MKNNKYIILGDIHNDYKSLKIFQEKYSNDFNGIIQVGDFGYGFSYEKSMQNDKLLHKDSKFLKNSSDDFKIYFIRGNHDNKNKILEDVKSNIFNDCIEYIPDGIIKKIGNKNCLFIGGAGSIDRESRLEGVSWWANETLNHEEMNNIIDAIKNNKEKIDYVISHDCPLFVNMGKHFERNIIINEYCSFTRKFLNEVYDLVKPDKWFFGHWHINMTEKIDNTIFQCIENNNFIIEDFN